MRRAFCFSRSCRLYSLSLSRPRPCSPGGYGRFSTRHLGLSALEPLRKSLVFSRRQSLQSGPVYLANFCSLSQTRRRLGGRQPLWGTGGTSWMPWIARPGACGEGGGGDALAALDLQAGGLQGADGRLPARARALDVHVDLADAVLLGPAGGLLGRQLGRERGRL